MNQRPLKGVLTAPVLNRVTSLVFGLVAALFGLYALNHWLEVRDREENNMRSSVVLLAHGLDAFFLAKQSGILTLADSIQAIPGGLSDRAAVQRLLEVYKKHRSDVSLVFITDMSGQFLVSSHTRKLTDLPTVGDTPAFHDFLREYEKTPGLYLGRAQVGKLTGDWAFSLRFVFRDPAGRAQAVLTTVFPTDFLVTLWKDAPLVKDHTVGVLRDDGYLLSRYPLPSQVSKQTVFGEPRSGALFKFLKENGFPSAGRVVGQNALIVGSEFVNIFQRLATYPVTVFVAQPQRQIVNIWLAGIATPMVVLVLLLIGIHLVARRMLEQVNEREAARLQAEAALKSSEAEQRFLVDHLMAGVVVHDQDGKVLRCNLEASALLGLSFEQMTGKQLIDPAWCFLQEDGNPMSIEDYPVSRVLGTGKSVEDLVLGIVRKPMEEVTWVLGRADPWLDEQARIVKVVVTFVDISNLRKLSRELNDRQIQYKALFDNSIDAVMQTDPDGNILAANGAACRLFRLSEEELKQKGRAAVVNASDPQLRLLLAQREREGWVQGLLTMVRGDGTHFTAEISSSLYADSRGRRYSSMIVRDITERLRSQAELQAANEEMRRINAQLAEMAHYDMLTHLPNRVLLSDRMQQALAQSARRGRSVGVAFIDLDGFKEINDRHGHAMGDQVLIQLSRRFKSALREGDTLARLGGDEFVVVMTDLADAQDFEPLVQRLLSISAEPVRLGELVLKVSASIGVTVYPNDASDAEQMLRHADQAMYSAKQAGKNRYHVFDVASDVAVRSRRDALNSIRQAYERREFVLHYQPQVDMRTGDVIGLEALIRWHHPERGLVAPGLFLPLIEDHDLAISIGEMVFDKALDQMERWQSLGLTLSVSINLFARHLQDAKFIQSVRQQLGRHPRVHPSRIKLEIVESNALDDISQVSVLMHACAELGVAFALDDFGTGYSSLTYLRNLPASLLKIDQSFVRDMLEDKDDLAIVQGVIGLAQAFGRDVIAEGVESVAHGRLLLSMGCALGQGYGIARPMPAEEVPQWIALWKARQPWIVLPALQSSD